MKMSKYLAVFLGIFILVTFSVTQPVLSYEVRDGKKIMVYAERQSPTNIDPSQHYDWSTRMMQQALYDALLKYVGNPPKLVPWIAKSYKKSADGKTWTFELVTVNK